MEDNEQLPDSTQQDESVDLEQHVGDESVDITELVQKNKTLFARAKKAETELKQYKGQPKETPAAPATQKLSELNTREVVELRSQGYTDKEILDLHEQASSFGVPISKLLTNPIVKEGVEAMRRKAKVDNAVPTPSSRSASFVHKGKSFGELKTDAERREAFNAVVAKGNRGDSE